MFNNQLHKKITMGGLFVTGGVYNILFHLIGVSFGSNNATTFKIPDARGRVSGSIGQGS